MPDGRELTDTTSGTVRRHLVGKAFEHTHRHGKHVFVSIEDDDRWLRLHFGMTGEPRAWKGEADPDPEHVRLRADFEDGWHLAYLCSRRFGQIGIVNDPEAFVQREDLGPDLRSLVDDRARFHDVFAERRGGVKSSLMNQHVAAGLGNIYADEVLFQARIHPETGAPAMGDGDWDEVRRSARHVVERAIEARADPDRMPRSWLIGHREEGATCPRCGATIQKLSVSGRPTYVCPEEQIRKEAS